MSLLEQHKTANLLKTARDKWPDFVALEPTIVKLVMEAPHTSNTAELLRSTYVAAMKQMDMSPIKIYQNTLIAEKTIGDLKSNTYQQYASNLGQIVNKTYYGDSTWAGGPQEPLKFGDLLSKVSIHPPEYKPTNPVVKSWSMSMGQSFIQAVQKGSRDFGYHVCLGGGVLNNGASDKDLDVYFLPLGGKEKDPPKPVNCIQWLKHQWATTPERIGKAEQYEEDSLPYIAKLKFIIKSGRRVDLFVLGGPDSALSEKDWVKILAPLSSSEIHLELGEDRIIHQGAGK